MKVTASPELQPWIRATDKAVLGLDKRLTAVKRDIDALPVADKPVFITTNSTLSKSPGTAAAVSYPASDGSVVHVNTTGLVQVTVTPQLRAYMLGVVGVGVYVGSDAPQVINGMPRYGVGGKANGDSTGIWAYISTSAVSVIAVPKGAVTYSMFYYTDTSQGVNAQCGIDKATLIVRSL